MRKQKKILFALPVVVLTTMLITGMAYGEGAKAGFVNADSVNIRENPTTSGKVLMQLDKETKIKVISETEDWYEITYNDTKGYIFSQYVTLKDIAISSGTINGTNVNVRSEPGTDSEILKKLDKGAKVEIFENSGDWMRILISEEKFGWVHKDLIKLDKAIAARGGAVERPADNSKSNETAAKDEKNIRQKIVDYAKELLGIKYVYGGMSTKGFDCSGFTSYVFKHFGIELERTAASQGSHGTKIDKADLKPGDLVFFDTNGGNNGISHVGIYIGGGNFIHASSGSGKKCVTISDMTEGFYKNGYMRSRRYIND